jgi:hypothetical protein
MRAMSKGTYASCSTQNKIIGEKKNANAKK